ncbi:MAG: hypothetical protein GXP31_16845 [Kiritimatiellaeota bacterium]|nr:hypothetical protein [Kiritimatiellota bacterium]
MRTRGMIVVLALSGLLHLALFIGGVFHPERVMAPDSYDYRLLAQGLLETGRFQRGDGAPEIYRTPGYPLFLAAVFAVAGPRPTVPLAVQCMADVMLCLLVFHAVLRTSQSTGLQRVGPGPAEWAAAWQAAAVVSCVYACRLLSDSLFAPLLLLAILWGARLASAAPDAGRHTAEGLAAGLYLGSLGLWRVVFVPFSLLLPALLLYRRRYRPAGAMAAGLFLVLGGWTLRNGLRAGYWGVSTVSALNLYRYEAAALEATRAERPFAVQQALFDERLGRTESQADQARTALREGLRTIGRAPFRMLAIHLRANLGALLPAAGEFLRTFGVDVGGHGTLGVLHDRGVFAAARHYFGGNLPAAAFGLACALLLGLKYIAAGAGILATFRSGRKTSDTDRLLLAALAYFLLVPGPAAHPRFRVPIEPVLSVYAGLGMIRIMLLARRTVHAGKSRLQYVSSKGLLGHDRQR